MTNPLDLAEALAAHMATTDLACLELTGPAGTLRLVRRNTRFVAEPAGDDTVEIKHVIVRAASPGIFQTGHPLQARQLAQTGVRVQVGDIIGFLRIGVLLTPIKAIANGVIAEVVAENGAMVGFGAPLFEIAANEGKDAP